MAPVIGFKSLQESRHRYKFWATLLGVITGNSAAATHVALEHLGIEKYFDHGYFGEDAASRADLVAAAATDYPGAVVVGDTPLDISAAKEHGCISVGVATGSYGANELRAANPDLLLPDLQGAAVELVALARSGLRRS